MPTGATSGDLLVIASSTTADSTCTATLSNGAQVTVNASAGTPTIGNSDVVNPLFYHTNAGSTLEFNIWYVYLTSTPGTTITTNYTCTPKGSLAALCYTGVNSASPIDTSSVQEAASTATITAPSVTTSVANEVVAAFFDIRTGTTITSPTNATTIQYTAGSSGQGAASRETQVAADKTQTIAGSSGSFSAAAAASGDTIGATVAIKPATANASPAAPTLITPANGATGVSTLPSFTLRTTDPDNDYLRYKIVLYQSDCTTLVGTFDQTASQTGWSGQDQQAGTAYTGSNTLTSSTIATYTAQSALANSTTYCWKAAAIDPAGTNTFSAYSATQSFTTAAAANTEPSTPTLSAPNSGVTNVSVTPSFTLASTDAESDYLRYKILLYQSDCSTLVGTFDETSSQAGWSGQNTQTSTAYTSGSTATYTYQGTLANNTTYCWKAAAIDPGGTNTFSSYSATRLFTTISGTTKPVNIGGGTNFSGGVHLGN